MAQRYLAEGSNAPLASRFAAVRVHLAALTTSEPHRIRRMAARLMAEGRGGSHKILAFYLARDTPLATLVDYAKLRWRIERDYEELKGELGLSHYKSRLAWLSPSCHALHRRLRILYLGTTLFPPQPPRGARCLAYPRYRPRGAAYPSQRHVKTHRTIRKRYIMVYYTVYIVVG